MSETVPTSGVRRARRIRPALAPLAGARLPWVERAPGAPYFVLDDGTPWAPVGANESVTWPELAGLLRRRDLAGAEAHLRWLRAHGVTVLRLMLEYAQGQRYYLERPAGAFVPHVVQLWDDLFALCERVGMRILLTPYDTFFHWIRWRHHPYNRRNGGPCADRSQLMVCRDTREFVLRRLTFAAERWGGSGALFAWDLWNELHPAQGNNDYFGIWEFVSAASETVREVERRAHGRSHPQTVSVFGPELLWKPELRELIFRHPGLDCASSHFYAEGTIDSPRDTVAPAVAAGHLVREALAEVRDARPFFESEHGPIYTFKDQGITLPAEFDDEYFRHIQWAHLASGGAGGGMRWPNRHPHALTPGMREAQRALAAFLPLVDWSRFRRRVLNGGTVVRDVESGRPLRLATADGHTPEGRPPVVPLAGCEAAVFACGDDAQAVAFVLRADALGSDGRVRRDVQARGIVVEVPGLAPGRYAVTEWDPVAGAERGRRTVTHGGGPLALGPVALVADAVLAARRAE
jgi:mannan endo-1,4-beta-mannosidase